MQNKINRRACVFIVALYLIFVNLYADNFTDGQHYFKINEPERAIVSFQAAMTETIVNPNVYNYLALALAQVGRYDEAFIIFEKGIKANGTDKQTLCFNAGNLAFLQGEYKKAREYFSACISENESFKEAYLNRANACLKEDYYEEALKDYKMYLTLAQDNDNKESVEALVALLESTITDLLNAREQKLQGQRDEMLNAEDIMIKNMQEAEAQAALKAHELELQQEVEKQQQAMLEAQEKDAFGALLQDQASYLQKSKTLDNTPPKKPMEVVSKEQLESPTLESPAPKKEQKIEEVLDTFTDEKDLKDAPQYEKVEIPHFKDSPTQDVPKIKEMQEEIPLLD